MESSVFFKHVHTGRLETFFSMKFSSFKNSSRIFCHHCHEASHFEHLHFEGHLHFISAHSLGRCPQKTFTLEKYPKYVRISHFFPILSLICWFIYKIGSCVLLLSNCGFHRIFDRSPRDLGENPCSCLLSS